MIFGIAFGGALGSVARYAIGHYGARHSERFPWATLLINVAGSFLLGLLVRWLPRTSISPELGFALTVGLCGGFTTFSTFSVEVARLIEGGAYGRAATYATASVLLSLAATFAGFAAANGARR
jgi:fluoride exporter